MMFDRREVEFDAESGLKLRGWLFVPEGRSRPRPALTMADVYGGVKEHGLERFARAFAEAGFVVLVHDHRNFGASDGAERGHLDPDRRLMAVVAQVPTISGFEQGLRRIPPEGIGSLERAFAEDDRGQLRGELLHRQLVVSDD